MLSNVYECHSRVARCQLLLPQLVRRPLPSVACHSGVASAVSCVSTTTVCACHFGVICRHSRWRVMDSAIASCVAFATRELSGAIRDATGSVLCAASLHPERPVFRHFPERDHVDLTASDQFWAS